jgi:hypothetical protein
MLNDMHVVPDINVDPSTAATQKTQHFSLSHEQQQQKCLRLVSLEVFMVVWFRSVFFGAVMLQH